MRLKLNKKIESDQLVEILLRLGLIIVFAYAAIDSLIRPLFWVGYLPNFLTVHVAAVNLLKVFAVYQLILVGWLISGKFVKYCALICSLTFLAIIILDFSQLIITFRDFGLMFMALALYLIDNRRSHN